MWQTGAVSRLGWTVAGIVGAGLAAEYFWERSHPAPLPYSRRFWISAPRPMLPVGRLLEMLDPKPGERMLEIGPGTGTYTFDVARALGRDGVLDVFDISEEMLDHLVREARRRGLENLVPTQGDAEHLPYEDARFDAVYVINVLGEVADRYAAMRELRRVVKPSGRVVIAENAVDPHWILFRVLKLYAQKTGFEIGPRIGNPLSYYARLRPEPRVA
jgi:ubiquinone/menaquinone biosynthesis C-methylase UbiE